ncbi:hypothetical protein [Borreliella americana]|uniref:hypothetical protein n=1 Tax=Borreliella americana TaxID=478807 RepID=UPI001E34D0A3|nr:hypothetical protein [Borreliella americana]MCD2382579.1 hypothetical protein [Borreliella americana]
MTPRLKRAGVKWESEVDAKANLMRTKNAGNLFGTQCGQDCVYNEQVYSNIDVIGN